MIELVFTACLIAEPQRCREVRLTYAEESVTLLQCTMSPPLELAAWFESRPAWRLARWGCRPAGRYAKA